MDYNKEIAAGIDLIITQGQEIAEEHFYKVIDSLKKELSSTKDRSLKIELNLWWAQVLELLEEYEQALIRLQKAMEIDYSNAEIIYRIASLFVYALGKPQHAIPLLEEKLLKWQPENQKFIDLLDQAKSGFGEEETEIIEID